MTTPPCRLFVIVAARAPVAVVFRRGPSEWYQVIAWDLAKDTFTDGAWFKGRIYEEKCDLSPDGELLLYCCHGGAWREGYTDSWTAVSRLPWLHALALWPQGTTYGGGGRFVEDRRIVLRGAQGLSCHPDHPGHGLTWELKDAPRHASTDEVPDVDWSGRDCNHRIIYARQGRLFRIVGQQHAELADFNGRTPDPVSSPQWAREPIGLSRADRLLKRPR